MAVKIINVLLDFLPFEQEGYAGYVTDEIAA
jgi:hypothetical protein